MENYEMSSFEEQVADEMFADVSNDFIYDSDIFPIKDRKQVSARRKKAYFKGKKRVETLYAKTKNWTKYPKRNEAVLRGVLRDTTSVIKAYTENGGTRQKGFNRSAIRRQLSAKDKIMDYAMGA